MKKLMLLFMFLGFLGFTNTVQAQAPKKCAKKSACCAKKSATTTAATTVSPTVKKAEAKAVSLSSTATATPTKKQACSKKSACCAKKGMTTAAVKKDEIDPSLLKTVKAERLEGPKKKRTVQEN